MTTPLHHKLSRCQALLRQHEEVLAEMKTAGLVGDTVTVAKKLKELYELDEL